MRRAQRLDCAVPGRDIFVQAWYQGGLSVIDFTDSANPVEIAYFDRGPIDAEELILGGYWSTYWYDGRIYGTEIVRGLDVLALEPSEYLTENEIAAALLADQGDVFNPQQQFRVSWPAEPAVARAYLDQLERQEAVTLAAAVEISDALRRAETVLDVGTGDDALARTLRQLAGTLALHGDDMTARQTKTALAATLSGIASGL